MLVLLGIHLISFCKQSSCCLHFLVLTEVTMRGSVQQGSVFISDNLTISCQQSHIVQRVKEGCVFGEVLFGNELQSLIVL